MIISNGLLKNVEFLRERMNAINHKYKIAFRIGFWIPLIIFGFEVFYYACRLIVLNGVWMHELFKVFEADDAKQRFSPDMIILLMPIIYAVFSFVSFKMKMKVMKYFLALIDVLFFASCIVVISMGFDPWLYVSGMLYAAAVFIVCVDCIKADMEDEILSRIDGYPHFNPILIKEEISMKSEIRFPDKKSYDQLYDERMEVFAEENPESEMAKLYKEEKKAAQDAAVDSWLGEMFVKNEKNDGNS